MINGDSHLRAFGKFRLDPDKRVLWFENEPVNLPLKEVELLCVLTESSGQVITKDEILDRVWGDSFVEESNLSRHIYLLRKTLKEHGESEDLIQTIPRRGYRFTGHIDTSSTDEFVLERRTSTTTLIEIDDRDFTPGNLEPYGIPVSKRTMALILACVIIVAVGIAATITYWQGKMLNTSSEIRSIAVLPVRSFAHDSDNDELRLRITDALITRLGGMSRIAVRPTSAILPFSGSTADSGVEVGRKLRVDAVIDSYMQREGDRLRVTVQVVRVSNGEHVWSEQFDGQTDQILRLQDLISAKVLRAIRLGAEDHTAFEKRPTDNAESYEAYLKGRYFATKRDEASLRKAIRLFTQAKDLDPQFSEAYSSLADTRHLLFNYNIDVRPEIVLEAKQELARALELKPDSADALITLGTIQMGYDWDWVGAEASLKQAIETAPNSTVARMRYGALLVRTRRFQESQSEFEKAIELDPLSLTANTNLGMVMFCQKAFEAADRQYGKSLELEDGASSTHWLLSRSLWLQGRKEGSIKEIAAALSLDGNSELAKKIEAQGGVPENAIRLLINEWRLNPTRTNPHNLAYLSTYLNDKKMAMDWLKASYKERHPWTTWAAAAPEFEILRGEPIYEDLLRKMNLVSK